MLQGDATQCQSEPWNGEEVAPTGLGPVRSFVLPVEADQAPSGCDWPRRVAQGDTEARCMRLEELRLTKVTPGKNQMSGS